jgi:hypothetical protein
MKIVEIGKQDGKPDFYLESFENVDIVKRHNGVRR